MGSAGLRSQVGGTCTLGHSCCSESLTASVPACVFPWPVKLPLKGVCQQWECQQSCCRMGNTISNPPPETEREVRQVYINLELTHLSQGNSHPLVPTWCWLWHLPSAVNMSKEKCKQPVSLQLLNIQYFRPCSTHLLAWMTMSNSFSGLRKQKRS